MTGIKTFNSIPIATGKASISHDGFTAISSNSDMNDFTDAGNYRIGSHAIAASTLNLPAGYAGIVYVVDTSTTTRKLQVYINSYADGPDIYYRQYIDGTWFDWNLLNGDNSSSDSESEAMPVIPLKFMARTASSSATVKSRLVSMYFNVKAGAIVKFKPNGSINRMFINGWSSPYYEPRNTYQKWANQTGNVFVSGWTSESFVIPNDCYVTVTLDTGANSVAIDANDVDGALTVYGYEVNNIVESNDAALKAIAASRKQRSNKSVLTLLHFSDIHGDAYQLSRIVDFANSTDMIDDVIHSGDMMLQAYDELVKTNTGAGTSTKVEYFWWDYAHAGNILNCIGNHDLKLKDKAWTGSGVQPTTAAAFNRYFATYYQSWGVVWGDPSTPSNAMYYYKDYNTTVDGEGIRLVVLDENSKSDTSKAAYQATQVSWFEGVLADAITNNLAVIVVQHYMFNLAETSRVDCSFTSQRIVSSDTNTLAPAFEDAVNQFVSDGGEFICWMAGHLHNDIVQTKNGQLLIDITTGSSMYENTLSYSDLARNTDDATGDAFNVVTFDRDTKHINIVRVGSDRNYNMKPRKAICLNYATASVVYDNL